MSKKIISLLLCAVLLCSCSLKSEKSDSDGKKQYYSDVSCETVSPDAGYVFTKRDGDYSVVSAVNLEPGETIEKEGVYLLGGKTGLPVIIDAEKTAKIQLVLRDAEITSADGPAILILSADKVFITLEGKNTVTDAGKYASKYINDGIDGAIFSKSDLTVNGTGSLSVDANYAHGIVSKKSLVFSGCTVGITSVKSGFVGDDIKIRNLSATLDCGTDGIKATNKKDSDSGFVYIESGSFAVTSGSDCIQAERDIFIQDGSFSLTSGGGSSKAGAQSGSYKGLKSSGTISVNSGTFVFDCRDDALHCAENLTLCNANITISTGDDAVHSDAGIEIRGGRLTVTSSYEGIEAVNINILGGKIDITSSDDGINAAGGGKSGGFGWQKGEANNNTSVNISGGYIKINASGDGIDSNGEIKISGGITLISGPTNPDDSAFDHDGNAVVSGGTLIAIGAAGMVEGITRSENQGSVVLASFQTQKSGTTFAICDSDGNVIASMTADKEYSSAVITSPNIQTGGKYTVKVGGKAENTDENGYTDGGRLSGGTLIAEFEMTSSVYTSGNGNMGPGGPGIPDNPGGPGRQDNPGGPGRQDIPDGPGGPGGPGKR